MDRLVIVGGGPLRGTVRVGGAKNAALPIMAASLLLDGPTVLHRVPRLRDVDTMAGILRMLGVAVEWVGPQSMRLVRHSTHPIVAPFGLVRRMRGSVCVLGPLLATRGAAIIPLPGGCVLGERPIDLHLKGMEALGAEVRRERAHFRARARRLRGACVDMAGPRGSTVLGTANVLMAAALAEGRTVIQSAAVEPEVQDLTAFLTACGARIRGLGTRTLTVDGAGGLHGVEHELIPDRLEAGTYLAAAALAGGEVTVEGARPDHMWATLDAFRRIGVELGVRGDRISATRTSPLVPADLVTGPHPALPTDMQPQLSVLLCLADGVSTVEDRVYPERFTHAAELARMGACIERTASGATIRGVASLRGASVHAADLRAGAALALAGLAAEGATLVSGVDQIDRGYQSLEQQLRSLGADIRRERTAGRAERRSA